MPEFKLFLEDDEVEALKILAAKRRVRPQAIAREAFRAGMAARECQAQHLPQTGDAPDNANLLISELQDLRKALRRSLQILEGVLSDADVSHEELAEVGREVDQITSDSGDAGEDSRDIAKTCRDVAPIGVRQKPGRRAR